MSRRFEDNSTSLSDTGLIRLKRATDGAQGTSAGDPGKP